MFASLFFLKKEVNDSYHGFLIVLLVKWILSALNSVIRV
jgi:hypothetical protein